MPNYKYPPILPIIYSSIRNIPMSQYSIATSQVSFNQQFPPTKEVTKDKYVAFQNLLQYFHRVLGIDFTAYLDYDSTSAIIHVLSIEYGSCLFKERIHALVAQFMPHKANDESFIAEIDNALEFYSSKGADEQLSAKGADKQLFNKRLVEGTNGNEFAYSLNPDIKRDGLAYSRYLVHHAFNMAHIHGDADFISTYIIERCSISGHPDLLDLFFARLKELCYDLKVCDEKSFFSYYVRFIYRKSHEDVASSGVCFEHLYGISRLDNSCRMALIESYSNLSDQTFDMLYQL